MRMDLVNVSMELVNVIDSPEYIQMQTDEKLFLKKSDWSRADDDTGIKLDVAAIKYLITRLSS